MESVLELKTLVLNKNWRAFDVIPVFDAVCKVFSGKADIITKSYDIYTFEEWVENWEDLAELNEIQKDNILRCARYSFATPEVIRLKEFDKFKPANANLVFSRQNIFERDNYTCQYCGKVFPSKKLSLDHVIPKSRGGKTNWTNIVLSCMPCNTKKDNKTPKEANMALLKQPFQPQVDKFKRKLKVDHIPDSWNGFIGKLYWETTLDQD